MALGVTYYDGQYYPDESLPTEDVWTDQFGNPMSGGDVPHPDSWEPAPAQQSPYEPPAPTAPTAPTGPAAVAGGYDPNALKAALLAWGEPANAANLARFIAAHPEFATGVTIGGSKNNKLYGPGGVYLGDVIRGTDSGSPAWDWDTSTGGGGNVGGDFGDPGVNGPALDPSYLAPWTEEFVAPEGTDIIGQKYTPPADFSYADFEGFDDFHAPTADSILSDPSYTFRRNQGQEAIENSAAARGLLNSGGTLKDILGYGQNFASQEYGNIFDRDFRTWDTKNVNKGKTWQTGYDAAADAWTKNTGLSKDVFGINQSSAINKYNKGWGEYQDKKGTFYNNQDRPFNKLSSLLAYGASAAGA